MARRTTGKNRREKGRGTSEAARRRRAAAARERRICEKALQADLKELLVNGHTLAAELTGISLFGISEEEVGNLSITLAKVIATRGGLPKATTQIAKFGPWTNFVLVLAAVYGPRLVMLWKMWEAERAQRKARPLTVMSSREDSSAVPDVDWDKAVN